MDYFDVPLSENNNPLSQYKELPSNLFPFEIPKKELQDPFLSQK